MEKMTEGERLELKEIYLQRLENINRNRSKPLIENIKEAFLNVPYSGDGNLVSTPKHRAECEECQGIYNYFVGKTWEETLDKKYYDWLDHGQSFFLPLAWQYYLPAYLIQRINGESFSTLYFLPNEDPELVEFEENRINLLTSRQCDVIIEYLKIPDELGQGLVIYEEYKILETLNYWKENYRNALAKEQNTNE
ncbi:MAG: hypothetical protein LH472_01130 [Pyrinomonadaceae bacterium]|nr:hypothetical protein [Pyrinomonadaceae bacterium]